jgi:hypothetical protein
VTEFIDLDDVVRDDIRVSVGKKRGEEREYWLPGDLPVETALKLGHLQKRFFEIVQSGEAPDEEFTDLAFERVVEVLAVVPGWDQEEKQEQTRELRSFLSVQQVMHLLVKIEELYGGAVPEDPPTNPRSRKSSGRSGSPGRQPKRRS